MERPEILKTVDDQQLCRWLRSVCLPALMEPAFFEKMGFQSRFVRQFLRKHRKVLLPGGRVARKVRGINEIDFLYGLADAIAADTTEA